MGSLSEKDIRLEAEINRKLKNFELNVRFSAGKGCMGILGPSGCGKSMTLKAIAGIVTPDRGKILLSGTGGERVLYDSDKKINEKPQKRRVGYLFQNYALFPNMTVEENIGAGLRGKAESREKIGEMTERFRLTGLEKHYPRQLSGGQQQRVALARILAYEPEVLLLDEPFSAMDAYLKEGLRLELARVLESYEGIAVLVTHDRDEAYQLCDRLLMMDKGNVLLEGMTRELFANPVTVQAARLTGCKNISRIERLGKHKVRALDWNGLELATELPVTPDITAIGIRAHDFFPFSAEGGLVSEKAENIIPVNNPVISEMPFEWYVTLDNGLWWKTGKTIHIHHMAGNLPLKLYVSPSAILLLKDD